MRPSSLPVSGRAHGRFRTSVSAAKNPVPGAQFLANDASLDHLVGAGDERRRNFEAERLGSLDIDHEFVFGRLLDWQLGGLLALEDAIDIAGRLPVLIDPIGPI